VLQQAMLGAWRALRAGSEVEQVRPWLYRIVRNAALRNAGGSDVPTQEALHEGLAGADEPEGEVERRAAAGAALAAVAALPDRQREAFVMTALEGRSGTEVAGALGLSENATRQLIYRARTTLRAAATAVIPLPLLEFLVTRSTAVEIAGGGVGASALALKLGATVALTGAVVSGVSHRLVPQATHSSHHSKTVRLAQHRAPAVHAVRAVVHPRTRVIAHFARAETTQPRHVRHHRTVHRSHPLPVPLVVHHVAPPPAPVVVAAAPAPVVRHEAEHSDHQSHAEWRSGASLASHDGEGKSAPPSQGEKPAGGDAHPGEGQAKSQGDGQAHAGGQGGGD
jgi:RNA polymerase sigma factor (sigma-70 family)